MSSVVRRLRPHERHPQAVHPAADQAEQPGQQGDGGDIVTATISAEPQPIVVSIGMPATCRPAIATTTVMPAKSTDSPAVALARPTASGTGMPVGEVLPVPGQDEQRVVDADAEPEHRGDDGGDRRDGDVAREDADRAGADEQADQRDADGQAHRHQRAERDGEDDDRDGEADHLAAGLPSPFGDAEQRRCTRPACRRRAGSAVAACAASYSGRSILSVSKATVANAVRPSSLTVGPRGS